MKLNRENLKYSGPEELYFTLPKNQRVFRRIVNCAWAGIFLMTALIPIFAPDASTVARISSLAIIVLGGGAFVIWWERSTVKPWVRATSQGLFIYNGFRIHIVAWSEVAGFEKSRWRPFQMAVRRVHGRQMPMSGIVGGWFGDRQPQFEKMHELEKYWRQRLV